MLISVVALAMAFKADWLVDSSPFGASVTERSGVITLSNGLISRSISVPKNGTTVEYRNLMTGERLIRAVKPEAWITIDGHRVPIGGLAGQPNQAFFNADWIAKMSALPGSMRCIGTRREPIQCPIPWVRKRPSPPSAWPPSGLGVAFDYVAAEFPGIEATVHYEILAGMPVLVKWLEVRNHTRAAIQLNAFACEQLGLVEGESAVDAMPEWRKPPITILSDYSFGGMALAGGNKGVHWMPDPEYKTQVNYELKTPCLVEVRPPLGPQQTIAPGGRFRSMRAFELLHDSDDRERQGLAVRRLYRTFAPWTTENPLMLHLTSTDPKVVHTAIDQAAECGFELVIISFWSGLDMEDVSESNIKKFRAFRDYAHSKGLELGGYSLLASRRINDQEDVINPKTGKTGGAIFGDSPCLCSAWGQRYFDNLRKFIAGTGFDLLEHDGSYPGDFCASTKHPGHSGLEDSQWNQHAAIAEFYAWCRERGMYLNVPDTYFLSGSNKTGMGYRESNWSLPRAQQHIHARQNLFDGTWEKTPSMGWMMVPLVEYQGGGPEATIEPLHDHLDDYRMHLTNNLAYGAQACYRGPRLYDTPETRAMVQERVAWFKKYRDILESDVIHLRRPDGEAIDAIAHVNPHISTRAMVVAFNPSKQEQSTTLKIPLRYAALTSECVLRISDGRAKRVLLDETGAATVKITVPPQGHVWLTFREK